MKILAIDPGQKKSGWVLFDTDYKKILDSGIDDNELLLKKIKLDYDVLCIEMIASYGMPVGQTTFETCLWVGRFIQQSVLSKIDYNLYYKKIDINPTICFSNKAKDSNIRQSLIDMFTPSGGGKTPQVGTKSQPGPLYGISSHKWAALAVAVTHSLKNKLIER